MASLDCKVVLTFDSVNEILSFDHSNESSLTLVLSHRAICFSVFCKMEFGNDVKF